MNTEPAPKDTSVYCARCEAFHPPSQQCFGQSSPPSSPSPAAETQAGDTLRMRELRVAWEAGFRLCRGYSDNHVHFAGAQKERQWVRFLIDNDLHPSQEIPALAQPAETASGTPRADAEARKLGRQEALAILLRESAEDFEDFQSSSPLADTGDYIIGWDVEKLKCLFDVDVESSLIDRLDGNFWGAQAKINELESRLSAQAAQHEAETRRESFPSEPPWLGGDVFTWPIAAQANYHSWLSIQRVHELTSLRAENERLVVERQEAINTASKAIARASRLTGCHLHPDWHGLECIGCMEADRDSALAQLATMRQAWQPIETAPRDKNIDLWVKRFIVGVAGRVEVEDVGRVTEARWDTTTYFQRGSSTTDSKTIEGKESQWVHHPDGMDRVAVESETEKATHWMPIPAPPALAVDLGSEKT